MELLAHSPSRILRFGVFDIDLRAAELKKHGIRIKLQDQPFQILSLLLEHPGELVTREELRQKLWSADTFVDFDRNLNKAMNKLRIALCDSAESPRFIETLHRRGYRFIAPVQLADSASSKDALPPQLSVLESGPHLVSKKVPRRRASDVRPTWQIRALTILAPLIVAGCVIAALRYFRPHVSPSISSAVPRRSIAVLGFKNLSGRTDEAWLSTALADWLTTELAAGEQLRTIPAESVARTRIELSLPDLEILGRSSLAQIGKNLGTELVVMGSYASLGEKSGGQVRLDLRLISTQTGDTIYAVSETGTEAHLFELISRAGEHLRAKLGIQAVTSEQAAEVAGALPSNHDAARLYSQGLGKLRVFDTLAARQLFEKAIGLEPNYALAHSALATAWAELGYDENASTEAKMAFNLSSPLPRAERLLVEGLYHEMSKNWEKAIEIYRALVEFFPDSLDYGLALADAQVNAGRGRDAEETIEALRKLPQPLGNDARIDLADARAAETLGDFRRDLDAATRAAEKARASGASLLLAQARADQAWALENLARFDDATAAAAEAKNLYASASDKRGVARAINYTGVALQYAGNPLGAKRKYEEALALYREIGNKWGAANELDDLGDVLLALGDLDGARHEYELSMNAYREIGHEDGVALAKGALASVLLAAGDPAAARQTAEESVEICRRIGDRAKTAIGLDGIAKALRAQGKLDTARETEMAALKEFEDIGDKLGRARVQIAIAQLAIDRDNPFEAAAVARKTADELEKGNANPDAALAHAVLSQAMLMQGNVNDAAKLIAHAASILQKSHNRGVELFVAIVSARVRAVSAAPPQNHAIEDLQQIVLEAGKSRFVNRQFEAQLALGELKLKFGNNVDARANLQALEKDASAKGFQLIAAKAARDLGTSQQARGH
jgi:eukaryotic-like serine/threonine-protein kinase